MPRRPLAHISSKITTTKELSPYLRDLFIGKYEAGVVIRQISQTLWIPSIERNSKRENGISGPQSGAIQNIVLQAIIDKIFK